MRLGFHYHVPAAMLDGEIRMPGFLGRFVEQLGRQCDEVVCFLHSPRADEISLLDYRVTGPNVTLVDVGPHLSVPARLRRAGCSTEPIREWRGRLDALLLRGPSPLLPAMARAAGPTPLALLLVGDYLSGADELPQSLIKREAIRLWALWNRLQQDRVARRTLTFVNSRALYERMRPIAHHLVETRTTTLTASDFYERDDTCQGRPIRLLYTGRIERAKGLLEATEALASLVAGGADAVLDLVGWPEKNDTIMDDLQALARRLGVAERMRYHGYKPVGPELFAYYRQADIYVLPSYHEGFPRTIWEAMAHSLPVVATCVGSIPEFVGEAAELVEPRNAQALAGALQRVLQDSGRRRDRIHRGLALARDNTIEKQTQKMITEIEAWAAKCA